MLLVQTTSKKKVTSKFCFPRTLDMGPRLSENQNLKPLIYDFSAILIHKGATVNSGHYVAHIKDEQNGIWWEFDDEQVSKLGFHPFGESSSSTNCKVGPPVKDVDSKSSILNGVVEGSLADE